MPKQVSALPQSSLDSHHYVNRVWMKREWGSKERAPYKAHTHHVKLRWQACPQFRLTWPQVTTLPKILFLAFTFPVFLSTAGVSHSMFFSTTAVFSLFLFLLYSMLSLILVHLSHIMAFFLHFSIKDRALIDLCPVTAPAFFLLHMLPLPCLCIWDCIQCTEPLQCKLTEVKKRVMGEWFLE